MKPDKVCRDCKKRKEKKCEVLGIYVPRKKDATLCEEFSSKKV